MSLKTQEIGEKLFNFGGGVKPLLPTSLAGPLDLWPGFIATFDQLHHHEDRDVRKRVAFLTDSRARVRQVENNNQ